MTRSTWLAAGIVAALVAAGGVAWWLLRGESADGQALSPAAAASRSADDIGASSRRTGGAGGSGGAAAGSAAAPSTIAAVPATIDPRQGWAAAADQLVLKLRFDDPGPVTLDERAQHLLGLREIDVDGRTVLAVITQDVQSGQIYTWSSAITFKLRQGQVAAEVLAGLPQLRNVFHVGERVVADAEPAAVPAVLRSLAQDGRVTGLSLMRIEPRSRPQ